MTFLDVPTLTAPLPKNHTRHSIPSGVAGTAETIRHMQALVTQGKRDFRIRELAGKIIKDVPEKNYAGYAKAIHDWIRSRVKYAFDPVGVELLESPWRIVEAGIADCDSSSILNAALLESIGLPAQFVTIKADGNKPEEFSHVFVQARIPRKGWMTSDCTMNRGFGWDPGTQYPRKTWPASQDAPEDMDEDAMSGTGMNGLDSIAELELGDLPLAAGAMGAFGDSGDSQDGIVAILTKIYDGTYERELTMRNEQARQQFADLTRYAEAIKNMPTGFAKVDAQTKLAQARKSYSDSRFAIDSAVIKYNTLADIINGYGFSIHPIQFPPPSGLSGMGVFALTAAEIATVAGVAALAIALSTLVYNIGGAINNTDGIITQLGGLVRSTGTAIKDVGTGLNTASTAALKASGAGLIIAAAVAGIMLLQKGKKA